MPESMQLVWTQIKEYLSIGCSIVPARDKDDEHGKAKTPYRDWKKYQTQQITEKELFQQLDHHQTTSIALICGKISGNVEVIDVDVKYLPGIDAELFSAIKSIYPNLWSRLRIHKTPSGGYHIIYRTIGQDVPGNKKLAGRESTTEEKQKYIDNNPKRKELQYVHFLETRGEGGIIVLPPSGGYSVFQNNTIPVISWEDRCSLIALAESFTKIPKVEKYKPAKKDFKKHEEYYTENPFEDYNNNGDALDVMIRNGWSVVSNRSGKIWMTKPGGKNKDVHGAYFTESKDGTKAANLFYCFTTAATFEPEVAYTQSAILCHLEFGDDWKKLYSHLVERGYGKIRKDIEQKLAKKGELPANASEEAKKYAEQYEEQQKEAHPFGVFWTFDEDGAHISREHLYNVSEKMGFVLYMDGIYRKNEIFLDAYTTRGYYDALKSYIRIEDGDEYIDVCNAYEAFLQKSGKFTIERLPELKYEVVLVDTRNICYKFFKNCYMQIDRNNITQLDYEQFPEGKYVFSSKVQERDFKYDLKYGIYEEFLQLAIGEIDEHVKNLIGFLAHEYKDETTAYIIVLTEKCLDPKDGGGSGKNLFCSLFGYTSTYISKPGADAKFDANFFQVWQGEKIFCISDVDKDFKFSFLKEPSSGNMLWKRLFKNQEVIDPSNTPKIIVLTNYSYEVVDGGLKRRIIGLEFTNYFTDTGGVDVHFDGKHFPKDWDDVDFNKFDTYIMNCVQHWLRSGRKLKHMDLSATGWEKQFIQTHNATIHDIINEYWNVWTSQIFVGNSEFAAHLNEYYQENGIAERFRPIMKNINKALAEWAARQRVKFNGNITGRNQKGEIEKGKQFGVDLKNVKKDKDEEENPF